MTVERGDREKGCRCHRFALDDEAGHAPWAEGWYGPKCPHHPPVEIDP